MASWTPEVVKVKIGCHVGGKPSSSDRRTEILRHVAAKQIDDEDAKQDRRNKRKNDDPEQVLPPPQVAPVAHVVRSGL